MSLQDYVKVRVQIQRLLPNTLLENLTKYSAHLEQPISYTPNLKPT